MKNYTITVNGNVYDVTVEESTGSAGVPAAAKSAVPHQLKAEAPAPAAAPVKAASTRRSEGSVKVTAPMPGKILSVKVSAGQAVKKGDVLVSSGSDEDGK